MPVSPLLVTYDVAGSNWRLTVSDNGVGMPDGSTDKPPPGLGTTSSKPWPSSFDARVEGVMDMSGATVSITHTPFPVRLPPPEAA